MIQPFKNPVYVTKPFLPPREEFCEGLKEIWDNRWLTNHGPVLRRFEAELSKLFGTRNICLFVNGTLALQLALQGMDIHGEVITTPFTFVATTHALQLNNISPVFVDIEPDYYTLDPLKVEAAITSKTTAILAVHIFGHPCNVDALKRIAEKHNLKLIYDAAHAFGVSKYGKSISRFGDMSVFSFHATKFYHSIEGGMLAFPNLKCTKTFDYLKNFGFENEIEICTVGTNAKMNEMQALMGLTVLKYIDAIIKKRAEISRTYKDRISDIPGMYTAGELPDDVSHNNAFMPVEVDEAEFGMNRNELYLALKEFNIFTRRYFYPLVCDYDCYTDIAVKDPLTVARKVTNRILTLPVYHELNLDDVNKICDIILEIRSRNRD